MSAMPFNDKLSETIARLANEARTASSQGTFCDAAALTGGLPVYEDLGGVLVLMPDGSVQSYDPDRRIAIPVFEGRWVIAALVKAAKRYRELASLHPSRPQDGVTCEQCRGAGTLVGDLDCGRCMGTGWTKNT